MIWGTTILGNTHINNQTKPNWKSVNLSIFCWGENLCHIASNAFSPSICKTYGSTICE